MRVQCPNCSANLTAPAEFGGKTVRCQQCQQKFKVPTSKPRPPQPQEPVQVTTASPPEIESAVAKMAMPTPIEKPTINAVHRVDLPEARGWTDLLDLRLRYYLTPRIACMLYILSLLALVIYFSFATFMFGIALVGINTVASEDAPQVISTESAVIPAALTNPQAGEFDINAFDEGNIPFEFNVPKKSAVYLVGIAVFTYLVSCVALFVIWLIIRMVCEAMVIQFHNASTLRRIEAKL